MISSFMVSSSGVVSLVDQAPRSAEKVVESFLETIMNLKRFPLSSNTSHLFSAAPSLLQDLT